MKLQTIGNTTRRSMRYTTEEFHGHNDGVGIHRQTA
jgi:hypothetical protein